MKNNFQLKKGFTLVEILVVISIMAITGVFVLSNYRSFGEDQNLKNAALDIQSLLRQAQTNVASGVKDCYQSNAALNWFVNFDNVKALTLGCSYDAGSGLVMYSTSKPLDLPTGITISSITAGGSSCNFPSSTVSATFIRQSGAMTFLQSGTGGGCDVSPLEVILTNSATSNTKKVILEKGGRIYVQ